MEVVHLSVTDIDAGDRLRPVDEDYAAMIGASMAQIGQRAPIEVLPQRPDGKYPLIAGAHRVHGAILAGLTTISAVVRDVDPDTASLIEIDENLMRHDLNPLDRAMFLAQRKDIYERQYPKTKAGAARWKGQTEKFFALIPSFSAATAEKLGLSERSIEMMVKRARFIAPAVLGRIKGTWIARVASHLDAIAKLGAEEQMAVVEQLLDHDVASVAEALRIVRQVPPKRVDVVEGDLQRLQKLWNKSDITAKAQFLAWARKDMAKTAAVAS